MKDKNPKNESYIVFARKFRPQIFDEVKGQEAIVTTLKNALLSNRVPQSLLFTGTRGVGKTSMARILAKSLNCETGPTVTPCGKCPSCLEITAGSSLDVIEIDGASNNSVDNIRDLRESIAMSPVHGRYKIYIIDEVHMLSGGAFNALLKTLEEPPKHAKFIFATTDAHKVPQTILSRCQKFQFRRIPFIEITQKLEEIVRHEKLKADPEALKLIARASEGSLRDAESLLDQLTSFSEGKISAPDVEKNLGLASFSLYLSLIRAWAKRDSREALTILESALDAGLEILPFTKGLYEMIRHLLIAKVHPKPKNLIDLSPELIEEITKESQGFTEDGLIAIALGLEKLIQTVQYSPAARFALEAAVIRFSSLADTASIPELLRRLEKLDKKSQLRLVETNEMPTSAPRTPSEPVSVGLQPSQTPRAAAPSPSGSAPKAFFTLDQVDAIWPQVIQDVEKQKMSVGPALAETEPIETEEGVLILGFPKEFIFHKETLERDETRKLIEKSLSARLGSPMTVKVVLTEVTDESETREKPAPSESSAPGEVPPIVDAAMGIFKSGRLSRGSDA